ncbi:uncharacterized protein LOC113866001 [Abrus precatorius]|uniref:Uncharacterized protein LOC113866001 n=1 Tax=Abrus precatorius TaxID=3816 RepID=A0A8B8LP67_ABRPR|nr:uncharacterized protein LOC113866001 [Abrus precatorius]
MNVLGLSLVLASLAAAGIFSPSATPDTQQQQKQGASTIFKEGHRVVVVEYDQDGHQNTKISISPEQPTHHDAKELICDAYGKCKHKIADAMDKTKDKAQEAIHKKKDMIAANKEAARQVGDTVADALGKAKETVYDKAHDVQEHTKETAEILKEHIVNNISEARDTLRDAKDAMKRVACSLGSMETLGSVMGVASLLGFATAYGMCVWITFISSYVLARAMPRQQFAVVQSKIYPVYFRVMAYSIGIALLGHVLGHPKRLLLNKAEALQAYNLLASLFTVFVNSLYLEPRATKLMFERIKIEKEEGRGRTDLRGEGSRTEEPQQAADPKEPSTTTQRTDEDAVRSRIIKLNDKLKKLNSYSSLLNILNLMSLTWHLVHLAHRVHRTC